MPTRELTRMYSHADTDEQAHALMITRECARLPMQAKNAYIHAYAHPHTRTLTRMGVLMCSHMSTREFTRMTTRTL